MDTQDPAKLLMILSEWGMVEEVEDDAVEREEEEKFVEDVEEVE